MFFNAFKILTSIRAKLLFAFFIIGLIVIGIGTYANRGIQETGNMVIQTYDGPMQASVHAERARHLFSRVETSLLQQNLRIRDGKDIKRSNIYALLKELSDDMKIVSKHSTSPKAAPYIKETQSLIHEWKHRVQDFNPETDGQLYLKFEGGFERIYTNLDIISEFQANAGTIERAAAEDIIQRRVSNIILFIGGALILALTLALWLSMTILNPLKTAVDVANKVSGGDYDVAIPLGRTDETGLLLKSMSVMQTNIRNFMARERNEKEMAKDYLAAALINSKDAILMTNAHGTVTIANERVKTLFPHVIGEDFIGGKLEHYFNNSGHPVQGSVSNPTDTGEIQLENGVWTKINASDMAEGGRLFIWTDITELKDREVNLRISKEKAEAADKAKTLFLASMSHELRTPLNAVIGFSDLMANETLGPIGNPEYVDLSAHILESGENLLNMIEDVLVVAGTRNETKATLDFEHHDLALLIDNAIRNMKAEYIAKNIGIMWDRPELNYTVYCNIQRLNRVFNAILSNAIRFNKDNGFIKIKINNVPDTCAKPGVFIDIADTGIGIAQTDIAQIMAPFAQADNSYTRAYDGAGLGLAIAKQWTELHDGNLSIASKLGHGTVVRIFLPALIHEAAPITNPVEAPSLKRSA